MSTLPKSFNSNNSKPINPASTPITVLIPVAQKDIEMLPYVIAKVRKYVAHPIQTIVILAPSIDKIIEFCRNHNLEFLDEDIVFKRSEFDKIVASLTRPLFNRVTSWYYQQLLKLEYANHSVTENYFVIDADVILNQPLTLINEYGYFFFRGHYPEYEWGLCSIYNLLGLKIDPSKSFVADMMIFNRRIVKQLFIDVQSYCGMPLAKAMVFFDKKHCRFSEYEIYGYYATYIVKIPAWYRPASPLTRSRQTLIQDLDDIKLNAKYPYMVYHSYIDGKFS